HLNGAGAQLRQHVGIAAELAVGKQLNVHPATRLVLDLVDRFAQTNVHRMGDDIVVSVPERELSCVARPRQDSEGSNAACGAGCGRQKSSACELAHERLYPLVPWCSVGLLHRLTVAVTPVSATRFKAGVGRS